MTVIQSAVKCFVAASEKERDRGWRKFSFLVPEENSGEALQEAPDTWSGQESCLTPPGTPHDQHLLTGLHCLCAGLLLVLLVLIRLQAWDSGHQWLMHIGFSLTLAPFHLRRFFCACVFFTEFPLVFSRYSARLKEQGYCLKVSWTCSRSGASCLRLSEGWGTLPGVYVCVNRSSLHRCKWNPRTIQSLVCRY